VEAAESAIRDIHVERETKTMSFFSLFHQTHEYFSPLYTIAWMCNGTSECTHFEWNINEHISLAARPFGCSFTPLYGNIHERYRYSCILCKEKLEI